jgi:hypothetical protein
MPMQIVAGGYTLMPAKAPNFGSDKMRLQEYFPWLSIGLGLSFT